MAKQQVVDLGGAVEQLHGLWQQAAPEFVEVQGFAEAVEKAPAGLPLEFAKGGAGSRLCQRHLGGSGGHGSVARDGSKYFELAEREMHICITYNFYLHNLFYGCYAEN